MTRRRQNKQAAAPSTPIVGRRLYSLMLESAEGARVPFNRRAARDLAREMKEEAPAQLARAT